MMAAVGRGSSCCDAARSDAMGKYLRAIYLLSFKAPPVSTSDVAARLGVAPPSVSAMLRRLGTAGLLAASGSGGIALSEHGQRHARDVIRRHRLIETFLVRAVGMSWDEVHDEAEALQQVVSDLLIDRIDTALGHPRRDPHGDPIPQPSGDHVEDWPPGARQRCRRCVLPGGPGQRRGQCGVAVPRRAGDPARGNAAGAGAGAVRRAAVGRGRRPAPRYGNAADPSGAWSGRAVTATGAVGRGPVTLRPGAGRGPDPRRRRAAGLGVRSLGRLRRPRELA